MGLAVSQIRLLALTSRKADIEREMQIDSKRKMMLTRKSTELAQQYYNRLQDTNIQYATSNGYEDVNYNYLMGESRVGYYTEDFLKQVLWGQDQGVPQKFENRMILTDQYGRVVMNDQMTIIMEKVKSAFSVNSTTLDKTAQTIVEFIIDNKGLQAYHDIFSFMAQSGSADLVDSAKRTKLANCISLMIKNGGYTNGGNVYVQAGADPRSAGCKFYSSAEAAKERDTSKEVTLQAGANYMVANENGVGVSGFYGAFYGGKTEGWIDVADAAGKQITNQQWTEIGNLVSYFAPMISAAIQNGCTTAASAVNPSDNEVRAASSNDVKPVVFLASYPAGSSAQLAHRRFSAGSDSASAENMIYTDDPPSNQEHYYEKVDFALGLGSGVWSEWRHDVPDHYPHTNGDDPNQLVSINVSFMDRLNPATVGTTTGYSPDGNAVNSIVIPDAGGQTIGTSGMSDVYKKIYLYLATGGTYKVSDFDLTANNGKYVYVQDTAAHDTNCGFILEDGMLKRFSYGDKESYNARLNFDLADDSTTPGASVRHKIYENAMNVDVLQAGLKSGTYQLCMVNDPEKGILRKNTTLTYFTHMNYVSDKMSTSAREEITAWFNAEQAAINEQETYWDSEIQNLSTELNAVNTEMEAVKTLKSDAIKKVFDWGGS